MFKNMGWIVEIEKKKFLDLKGFVFKIPTMYSEFICKNLKYRIWGVKYLYVLVFNNFNFFGLKFRN